MLRVLRILGLLAPVAVAVRFLILPQVVPSTAVPPSGPVLLVELISVLAGIGVTCLLVSLVLGTRIDRLAQAAERIAKGDLEIRVPVSHDPAWRGSTARSTPSPSSSPRPTTPPRPTR